MKEEEIRPQEIWDTYRRKVSDDIGRFFADKSQFNEVACPACQCDRWDDAFLKGDFTYVSCSNCGTLYVNPRPAGEQFDRFYGKSESSRFWAEEFYPATLEKRRASIAKPRAEYLRSYVDEMQLKCNTIMDIGCGYGIFMEELGRIFRESRIVGIEPGEGLANGCEKRGLEVKRGPLKKWAQVFCDTVDIACAFEILEHLHSPTDFLNSVYKLLHFGGVVWMTSLSNDGFDVRILKEKHRNIYPPCHINILSVAGVEFMMKQAGFSETSILSPGKLDVEIVRRAIKDGVLGEDSLGEFLYKLLLTGRKDMIDSFQQFLSENKLSSHMWIFGKK